MRSLILSLTLLLPLLVGAQGFGSFSHDQPFLAKDVSESGPNPEDALPDGIGYWWHADDLTNDSPYSVENWVDRVSGAVLTQPTAGNRPTWDTDGVTFASASSQYMITNAAINIRLYCGTGGNSLDSFAILVDRDSTGAFAGVLGSYAGAGSPYIFFYNTGPWYFGGQAFGSTTSGQWYDFICAGENAGTLYRYTNGVNCLANTSDRHSYVSTLGTEGSVYLNGTIRDFIIWTNTPYLAPSAVSNIHWYFTNVYTYTP